MYAEATSRVLDQVGLTDRSDDRSTISGHDPATGIADALIRIRCPYLDERLPRSTPSCGRDLELLRPSSTSAHGDLRRATCQPGHRCDRIGIFARGRLIVQGHDPVAVRFGEVDGSWRWPRRGVGAEADLRGRPAPSTASPRQRGPRRATLAVSRPWCHPAACDPAAGRRSPPRACR